MRLLKLLLKELNKGDRDVLKVDEHGKHIVYIDTNYYIVVDDPDDARYVTLWNKVNDKWIKVGYLSGSHSNNPTKEREGTYLKIGSIEIDKKHRSKGYGTKMYKALFKYCHKKIKGIYSYLPDRVNKKQIPNIYKKFNVVIEGDYQFILF